MPIPEGLGRNDWNEDAGMKSQAWRAPIFCRFLHSLSFRKVSQFRGTQWVALADAIVITTAADATAARPIHSRIAVFC